MISFFPKVNKNRQVSYNDRYFRIVLSLVAAHIMVMYNEPDTFFEALFTPSYYRGLVGSFIMSFLITLYIHFVTVRLDGSFDWQQHTLVRLFWQSLIAFLAPALLAFVMAAIFFSIYDINILKTAYLEQDYILVIFMLAIINIYYFGLNSFLRLKGSGGTEIVTNTPQGFQTIQDEFQHRLTTPTKEIIVVDTLKRSIPIRLEYISYCYILQGTVFLRTFEMETLNDSYQIPGNLRSLEDTLDGRMFFRINRQMIVNFNACKSYSPGRNKTLELVLDPIPYQGGANLPNEHKRLCVVSEDRASAFKAWMDR